ncbi:DUF1353 domain-containing protein [Aeromonas rivipollensis]|uniref:DUF1353 domain-containing protein n=1 Tax=Aeromonas rivipollensis TaxID=948519 RepID=UPI00259DC22E|nr:DUF1353 domain-containing protein [Aeromonas rivipollensis]MDM5060945.1 DUF1353 domain-containing protein [Aeromonas rivipollensis]
MSISRRTLIKSCVALPFIPYACAASADEQYADPVAADEWIIKRNQEVLHAVVNPLLLGRFADRYYFLTKEINWKPNPGQTPSSVQVPVGFVTDFASIPRAFWVALPTDGEYAYAAVIHDYLYWEQTTSREEADLVLKYAMQDFGISTVKITTIYGTVRAAGWAAWNENAKLKIAGEKRILRKYPEEPTTKWTDWKKKEDVFA